MASRRIRSALVGVLVVALLAAIGVVWRPWEWWHPDRRWGTWADKRDQTFTASDGTTSRYHVFAAGLSRDTVTGIVFQFQRGYSLLLWLWL